MNSVFLIEKEDFERLEEKIDRLSTQLDGATGQNIQLLEWLTNKSIEQTNISPEWITLEDACNRKGINKKTIYNKRYLKPNGGTPDGKIGGCDCWHRKTIEKWLQKTDSELLEENKYVQNIKR